jgi:hypothetical protein
MLIIVFLAVCPIFPGFPRRRHSTLQTPQTRQSSQNRTTSTIHIDSMNNTINIEGDLALECIIFDQDELINRVHHIDLPESTLDKIFHEVLSPLPNDFQPSNYCVQCGRGKEFFGSIGNRRFREIVRCFLDQYASAGSKGKKSSIVVAVQEIIEDAGGVFCKFEHGCWWKVSDAYAREKIGALFRDCLHTKYRSSGKSTASRQRARSCNSSQKLDIDSGRRQSLP